MKTSASFAHTLTLLIVSVAVVGLTVAVAKPALAFYGRGDDIVVPSVPDNLKVPVGNRVFLEGHAAGTQNYICMPCPNAITPQ